MSDEAQPYVDALIESMGDTETGDLEVNEDEARCVAPRWVETVGLARLEESGVTPDDLADGDEDVMSELGLTEAEVGELFDAMEECGVDVRDLLLAEIVADGEMSDENRVCLEEALDDDLLRRIFIIGALSQDEDAPTADEDLMGEMSDAFSECPGAIRDLFIAEMVGDGEISDEDRVCLEEAFDDDLLRRILVVGLSQDEDAFRADEDLIGEMSAAFSECPGAIRDLFIAGMLGDSEISDEDRACLEEALDDDLLRRIFVVGLSQDEDALTADEDLMGEIFAVFSECPGAVPIGGGG